LTEGFDPDSPRLAAPAVPRTRESCMTVPDRPIAFAGLLAILLGLTGCTEFFDPDRGGQRTGVSSSLVDYLYPKGEVPPAVEQQIPRLQLPLRVGLAFVPPAQASGAEPTEALKNQLLENVRKQFLDRKYIASIEVIPETYLRSTRGFEGMQQVARLYGADIMALVSYDQVAVTADNELSLTYWTIVGAYVIRGTENKIQTFVDTAVFDVPSRKLLFRAPGVDSREKSSTAIEAGEVSRETRARSFTAAMDAMGVNLVSELNRFEERLKTEPQLATIDRESRGGGGGSLDAGLALLLAAAALGRLRQRA
jgi:rhombotail lipoprotein